MYADITGQVEDGVISAAVFAIAAVLLWLKSRKGGKKKSVKASPKPQKVKAVKPSPATATPASMTEPTPEPTPEIKTRTCKIIYDGKVKGVTKQGRQKVLEKLMEMESEGETLVYDLEVDEYEGSPSIKVIVSILYDEKPPKQIGYIAAEDVEKVLPYVGKAYVDGKIYGGQNGKYYGAAVRVLQVVEQKID